MVTALPQVSVTRTPPGFTARCSCGWSVKRSIRVFADELAADHRASHATPLREDDDAPTFRIDTGAGAW